MLPELVDTERRSRSMKKALQMCLNWRVLAGLGGVGVILWLVAPKAVLGVLPFLVFLACPLSMVLMIRTMQGDRADAKSGQSGSSRSRNSREQGLVELKGRMADMRTEQELIARQIAQLEAGGVRADGSDVAAPLAWMKENGNEGGG